MKLNTPNLPTGYSWETLYYPYGEAKSYEVVPHELHFNQEDLDLLKWFTEQDILFHRHEEWLYGQSTTATSKATSDSILWRSLVKVATKYPNIKTHDSFHFLCVLRVLVGRVIPEMRDQKTAPNTNLSFVQEVAIKIINNEIVLPATANDYALVKLNQTKEDKQLWLKLHNPNDNNPNSIEYVTQSNWHISQEDV